MGVIIPTIRDGDWVGVRKAIYRLSCGLGLGEKGKPTFAGLMLTDLTVNSLIAADADNILESVTIGTGLNYTMSTLSFSHLGIEDLTDPGTDKIIFWDDSASACKWLAPIGNGLTISGTDIYWAWLNMESLSTTPDNNSMMVFKGVSGGMEWEVGNTLNTTLGLGTGSSPTFAGLTLNGTQNIGLDLSGGTWAVADIELTVTPIIRANAAVAIKFNDASYNVLIGRKAFGNDDEGTENTGLGYHAGYNNNTEKPNADDADGLNNTYIGNRAGEGVTAGTPNYGGENTGVGSEALRYNTYGYENTAVGEEALKWNTTGHGNCAFGNDSLEYSTIGNFNSAYGADSLYYNTEGSYNVAVGYQCLKKNTTGNYNIGIGYQCLHENTTIGQNVGIGYQALFNVTGSYNFGLGYQSGYFESGEYNTFIGYQAGYNNEGGTRNVYIGYKAGAGDTPGVKNSGTTNVAIGSASLRDNTTGIGNFALGANTLKNNEDGSYNVAIGTTILENNVSGSNNIAIGKSALLANLGNNNIALGINVLLSNTTGEQNIAIGYDGLRHIVTGVGNVAIGYRAGRGVLTKSQSYNTLIGVETGYSLDVDANNNVLIGYKSGRTITTGANNTFIGYYSGYNQTTNSNRLIIDNQDRGSIANEAVRALLYGTFAAAPENQELRINAAATIGNLEDGHYTQVEADGTIEFNGNATVWNDANVGAVMLTLPAVNQPDEDEFVDEAGVDTGISTWAYAIGEKSSGSIEIPHDYKEGSNLYFHIHWQGITIPADGTDNVNWQLTYTVAKQQGATLDAVTVITKEIAFDTQYEFILTAFDAIDGTNFDIGDQFLFTIERIAASADDYAGDALVATVGLHYECDTCGSRQILTKA